MTERTASVYVAVEGETDLPFAAKVVAAAGGYVHRFFVNHGKRKLAAKLTSYNAAARREVWLVLADWDGEADCPAADVASLLPRPEPGMVLRLAVHQLEAWVLGDREECARFLRVPVAQIPREPEALADAKRFVVDLARRSRSRAMAEMVPSERSGRSIGPGYTRRLIEFGSRHWEPSRARHSCASLDRAIERLRAVLSEFPAP